MTQFNDWLDWKKNQKTIKTKYGYGKVVTEWWKCHMRLLQKPTSHVLKPLEWKRPLRTRASHRAKSLAHMWRGDTFVHNEIRPNEMRKFLNATIREIGQCDNKICYGIFVLPTSLDTSFIVLVAISSVVRLSFATLTKSWKSRCQLGTLSICQLRPVATIIHKALVHFESCPTSNTKTQTHIQTTAHTFLSRVNLCEVSSSIIMLWRYWSTQQPNRTTFFPCNMIAKHSSDPF